MKIEEFEEGQKVIVVHRAYAEIYKYYVNTIQKVLKTKIKLQNDSEIEKRDFKDVFLYSKEKIQDIETEYKNNKKEYFKSILETTVGTNRILMQAMKEAIEEYEAEQTK
jgi:glycyl-tRNA synthetase (class II)